MAAFSSLEPLETRIAPAAILGPARLNSSGIIGGEVLPAPVTYVWDGSVSNDWFTAANWTPDGVPDADDTAILDIPSTINLPTDTAVGSYQQRSGIFTGPGAFTVLASFDWSGGAMSGTGTTNVAAGATLSISGVAVKTLSQRTLANAGTTIWGQGFIDFSNGATFLNQGSFVAQSDSVMRNVSGANTFTNDADGTFTNNTGATAVEVAFSNAGDVRILSGALTFNGNFAQTAGSTYVAGTLATNSILTFAGGELTGAGIVAGNVFNIGATVHPGNNGPGVLTINGNYTQAPGGILGVEIGGAAPGSQYDQLSVAGTAALDGTLAVALINSYVPATGTTFVVATGATRNGTFSNITGEGLLVPNYTSTQAQLINNATTFSWNGSAGDGNWFTPGNWTPAGIPGPANAGVLAINSTINLPSSTSVGSFQLINGTLTTAANVNFTALEGLTWTGGKMSGGGVTDVPGGILINGGTVVLDGRTLNVPVGQTATLSGSGAILTLQNGARVNNAGTFLIQNDTDIRDGGGAASLFNNSGTLTRSTTTGSFEIGVPLAQNGIVNVLTGTLALTGGSSAPATGDFNVAKSGTLAFPLAFVLGAGADVTGSGTVAFTSGIVTIGGGFTVPTVRISGGTANFNTPATVTSLTLSTGALGGTAPVTVTGPLSWSGGTMTGPGVTNPNGGLVMTGFDILDGRILNLPAGQTATVSGINGLLALGNGARFNNAGTFLAQNDNEIRSNPGAASLFTNSGTFTRETGTADFEIRVPLAHSGTINVATGTLSLTGGESAPTTGDFNVSSGAMLDIGSAFTLPAGADVTGAGTVDFSFGAVAIGGSFAIPSVTVSGGTANFSVATSGLQTLSVSGGVINFNAPASGLQTLTTLTITGGTANFNTNDTLNLTTLTVAGTLTGINTINSAGLLAWTAGTIGGPGIINANGGLSMTALVTLDGRTMNVPLGQTATLSGLNGFLDMRNGAHFNNAGTFLAQNDNDIRTAGAASLFNNSGSFIRNTTSGNFDIRVPLSNSGIIDVQTGSIRFQNGFSQSATASILGGHSVTFSAGLVTAGGTINALVSNSGAIFSPGESGAGDLTINGNYTQSGGTFRVELGGVAPGQFDKLTINGTAGLAGTLDLVLLSGFTPPTGHQFSVLTYDAHSGSFGTMTGAAGFTADYQATELVLTKAGVSYVWDAGAGVDNSWFNMLNWAPDGVPIAGDNATLSSNATISLPTDATVASFTQSNGILTGAATLTANTFTWTGGTQAGAGATTVPTGGTFNLNGPGLKILTQRTLNQGGAGIWTDVGNVQVGNGALFANSGSFDIQTNASFQLTAGGSQPLVTNSGTIHKTAGAGITTFNDLRVQNSGTLRVSVGTLALTGAAASFVQTGGATTLSGGSLSSVPTLDFTGGTLNGVGTISGSVSNNGATVQPGGSLAAGVLSITGNYTQTGSGVLAVDASGTTPGTQYDQLNVGGTAALGGTLAVSINGYTPGAADVLNIVTAGTRSGTFSAVTGASPLVANYTPTQVQLIFNNAPPPNLSINDLNIAEGASGTAIASFTVTLSAASNQTVTVQYATTDGTATAPEDYTALALSTLTFTPGEVSKTILVDIKGDTVLEQDETFFVNLSNPSNATLADAQAQGTIANDDIEVVITPDGGTATFTDVDGDDVVVKTTRGELTQENFVFGADGSLQMIDLTVSGSPAAAAGFGKAKLTVSANARSGGNGMVNVGAVNARGMSLLNVKIDGKLGAIDVGAGAPGERAFKSMKVDSLGDDVFSRTESVIDGTIGTLKVKHDVKGILNVTGGLPDDDLNRTADDVISKVVIGGNLDGSAGGAKAGLLRVAGGIKSMVIKGDVRGGADLSGIVVGGSIGSLKIGGDLSSADAAHPVTISALGAIGATKAKQAVALKTLKVGGDLLHAQILAGFRRDLTPLNPDASIGSIKVQGSWGASSVAAGVADVTGDGFGRNDALIPGDSTPSLLSRIASITVAGSATGSSDSTTDFFGITAQAVGRIQVGSASGNFHAGPDDVVIDPVNNDFRAVDFA